MGLPAHLHVLGAHVGRAVGRAMGVRRTCRWAGELDLTPTRVELNGSRGVPEAV